MSAPGTGRLALEVFMPLCVCRHSVSVHQWRAPSKKHPAGWRAECNTTQGPAGQPCDCREYNKPADPADWVNPPTRQDVLW